MVTEGGWSSATIDTITSPSVCYPRGMRNPGWSVVLIVSLVATAGAADFAPDRFGIGAVLVKTDSTRVEIRRCMKNGPAERAGLLPGDQLTDLDGTPVRDWSFQQVMDYLIRSEPTPLRITVRRGADDLSFELVRMRLADIAAGEGMGIEPSRGPGKYRLVPLNELPQLSRGEVVPLDSLFNAACRPSAITAADTSTVIYFWASWCGPCKVLFARLAKATPSVRLVAVNVDMNCTDFIAALAERDPPGGEYWAGGWYGALSQSLGVYRRGIPSAALIDAQGKLVRVVTGVDAVAAMVRYEPPAYLMPIFERAAAEFQVPVDVLISVSYVRSYWNHRDGTPDSNGECGVMGLNVIAGSSVDAASELLHAPRDRVMRDLVTNVRGGAALLRKEFVAVNGELGALDKMSVVEKWENVLPRFTRYQYETVNEIFFRQFRECAKGRGFGG